MGKSGLKASIIATCASGAVLGCIAAAWAMVPGDVAMDKSLEKACHQDVKRRTPLGHRDIQTIGYQQQGDEIGIARGSVQTRASGRGWAGVNWTCRVDLKKAKVLRVEFARSSSSSRLQAAASAF